MCGVIWSLGHVWIGLLEVVIDSARRLQTDVRLPMPALSDVLAGCVSQRSPVQFQRLDRQFATSALAATKLRASGYGPA